MWCIFLSGCNSICISYLVQLSSSKLLCESEVSGHDKNRIEFGCYTGKYYLCTIYLLYNHIKIQNIIHIYYKYGWNCGQQDMGCMWRLIWQKLYRTTRKRQNIKREDNRLSIISIGHEIQDSTFIILYIDNIAFFVWISARIVIAGPCSSRTLSSEFKSIWWENRICVQG